MLVGLTHGFGRRYHRFAKLVFLGLVHVVVKLRQVTRVVAAAWLLQMLVQKFLPLMVLNNIVPRCLDHLGASLTQI